MCYEVALLMIGMLAKDESGRNLYKSFGFEKLTVKLIEDFLMVEVVPSNNSFNLAVSEHCKTLPGGAVRASCINLSALQKTFPTETAQRIVRADECTAYARSVAFISSLPQPDLFSSARTLHRLRAPARKHLERHRNAGDPSSSPASERIRY